jgi:hypothetical protein
VRIGNAIDPDDASEAALAAFEEYFREWPAFPPEWGTRAEHFLAWLYERKGLTVVFVEPEYKVTA